MENFIGRVKQNETKEKKIKSQNKRQMTNDHKIENHEDNN